MKKRNYQPLTIFALICVATVLYGITSYDWETAILLGTGLIVAWTTYETYLLRLESQKGTEHTQTPSLTLHLTDGMNPSLHIKNDSDVIAYDINFTPFQLDGVTDITDYSHLLYVDGGDHYLEPRSKSTLKLVSRRNAPGASRHWFDLRNIINAMTASEANLILLMHFKNAVGQKYHLIYKLYMQNITTPSLQFIEAGKGKVSYEEAEEITRFKEPQLDPSLRLKEYILSKHS